MSGMYFYNKKSIALICIYGSFLGLNGCASITSEVICGNDIGKEVDACEKKKNVGDGIVYYLPKRDIRIDIAVAKSGSAGGGASPTTTVNSTITTSTDSPQNISTTISSGAKSDKPKSAQRASTKAKGKNTKSNAKESGDVQKPMDTQKAKVTITIPNNRDTETLTVLNHVFLLRYSKNWIGDNNMGVGVSPLGLLTVTHADTINKINDIAANIAVDAAAISMGVGALLKTSDTARTTALPTATITPATFTPSGYTATFNEIAVPNECKEGGYTLLIDPTKDKLNPNICGISIDISPVFVNGLKNGNSSWIDHEGFFESLDGFYDTSRSVARKIRNLVGQFPLVQYRLYSLPGLFYKQDIPYKVNIYNSDCNKSVDNNKTQNESSNKEQDQDKSKGDKPECKDYVASFLAFSPNASKVYFAPVTETLFTDNTSDITLVNGVVNSMKENTDSELLGLSKIPATVLGAYTNATGEIFSGLGMVTKNQGTLQSNEQTVLLNAQKITRCQMAIASNNLTGKTGDDLTKAYSAIQTACGN